MLHTVESALGAAYVRAFNPAGEVTVTLDTATGALDVRSRVVRPDGTVVVEELPSEDFKRMAAQTAKHAVLRHIHDLERDKVLRDVAEHRGELATGVVDRVEGGIVFVDLGRAEGVMPPEEQIPGELLHPGRNVLVVILDTQHNRRQAQVRVSRAARAFVHRLMEAEVPEIKAGTVQIRAIAREPGLRTKIAVSSSEPGLDPVGACAGPWRPSADLRRLPGRGRQAAAGPPCKAPRRRCRRGRNGAPAGPRRVPPSRSRLHRNRPQTRLSGPRPAGHGSA